MPLNDQGQEIPDDTPVVINIPGIGQVNQLDDVKRFMDLYLSNIAERDSYESIDDANDFDVDDDMFPVSAHEYDQATEAADLEALRAGDPTQTRADDEAAKAAFGGSGGTPPASPPLQGGQGAPNAPGVTPTPPPDAPASK